MARSVFQIAARRRWLTAGVAIPHDTADLRLAIKREIWTRGLTMDDVAGRVGVQLNWLSRVLAGDQRMTPGLLNRLIDSVHITAAVARRLHLLAAQDAGWKV